MADAPDQASKPLESADLNPASSPGDLELGLKRPEHTGSPIPAPWLHLEPDMTTAVIAKTEEELLSGLSALMRNKVENEKAQRRLATAIAEIEQAKQELLGVKNQIRNAEDELAARFSDHGKVVEEIALTQQRLQTERTKHLEHQEALFRTRNQAEESRRNLQNVTSELTETQETCRLMKAQVTELKKEITRLLGQRESLLAQIQPIRQELDQRLTDREAIIEQVTILHDHLNSLNERKRTLAAITPEQENEHAKRQKELAEAQGEIARLRQESERLRADHERLRTAKQEAGADLSDLHGRVSNLRFRHAELLERLDEARQALALTEREHNEAANRLLRVETPKSEVEKAPEPLTSTPSEENAQPQPTSVLEPTEATSPTPPAPEPELPLLLGQTPPPVANSWDSYLLESEFFTEEPLNASRVADFIAGLPGIEHSLIVQQFGPVLADRLPERFHPILQVPRRDYALLYDRLPNKVREYANLASRAGTYQIGDEFLTLAGTKEVFLLATHEAPNLRPGIPEKLAIVADELGKMYPVRQETALGAR